MPPGRFDLIPAPDGAQALQPAGKNLPVGQLGLPAALHAGPGAHALLHALRRRWLLALVVAVAAAVAAAGAAWSSTAPQKYSARALLYISFEQPQVLFMAGEGRTDFATYRQRQAALLKSRVILQAAVQQPQAASLAMVSQQGNAAAWLEQQLKTDYAMGPEILRVSLKGNDPDEVTTLVNTVVDTYLREFGDRENSKRQERLDQLQLLHQKYLADLAEKQQALSKLARRVGSNDASVLSIKEDFALRRLHAQQQEVLQYQAEATRKELELATLLTRERAISEGVMAENDLEDALKSEPIIVRGQAAVAELELHAQEILRVAVRGADDPTYRRLQQQLEQARRSLDEQRGRLTPVVRVKIRETQLRQTRAAVAVLKDRVAVLQEHNRIREAVTDEPVQHLRALKESSVDMELMRSEVAHGTELTRKIQALMETLKIELLAPARVSWLERASAAETNEAKRQVLMTSLVGAGTFFLVLFGIARWEVQARRIDSTEEVAYGLGLRVLGTVPAWRSRNQALPRRPAAPRGYSSCPWTEAIDAVRTLVRHLAQPNDLRTLLVASAVQGEGKTTLASHLAASLARAGHPTLLIDGDLRRPAVHGPLAVQLAPGLSEVLRGEADVWTAIQLTRQPNLAVLPAGRLDERALQALAQGMCRPVFASVRERFAYVIVDSSPILPITDALLMAQDVDGVILSVLLGTSSLPALHAAAQRLDALNTPVLGSVVQGVRGDSYGTYYDAPARLAGQVAP